MTAGAGSITRAARLAQWTKLKPAEFKLAYLLLEVQGQRRSWPEIVALAPDEPIKRACEEAEDKGFFENLAINIGKLEADSGRADDEVAQMLSEFAAIGIAQGMSDQQKGFMNSRILLPLHFASLACARVYRSSGGIDTQIGTAFLVRSDLVITAAHVALEILDDNGVKTWSDAIWPDLTFRFAPRPNDPYNKDVWVTAARPQALVSSAPPHCRPPNMLDASFTPPAGEHLDYVLVRLAQQIIHIDPVPLADTAAVENEKPCWVFGFAGGGDQLLMDVDKVVEIYKPAGRWRHLANAASGTSGGCCMNHEGQLVGLHEGRIDLFDKTGIQRTYNRGISMSAIRASQCKNGADPLAKSAASGALEFFDPELVRSLYSAGKDLVPAAAVEAWRQQIKAVLGVDPESSTQLPTFHPWIPRQNLEDWIDDKDKKKRICFISGDRGTGKSFCVHILRAKLPVSGGDLLALNATQTTAIGWEDAVSQALAIDDRDFRTDAGVVKYSAPGAVVEELLRRSQARGRQRFVTLDFGHNEASIQFDTSPWFELAQALVRNDWIRLILIGLDAADQEAVIERLGANPQTETVRTKRIELKHIEAEDIEEFANDLCSARGVEKTPAEIMKFVDDNFVSYSGTSLAALQTCGAALTAIAFERDETSGPMMREQRETSDA